MLSTFNRVRRVRRLTERLALAAALLFVCGASAARGQNTLNGFNSGSTGADGAFAPTSSQNIVVPDSGVFNFTTVNIPSSVQITFLRNSNNKPVVILASGDVTISGIINIDGKPGNSNGGGGAGGPGGFDGGSGGYPFDVSFSGSTGDGPGGGGGGSGNSTLNTPSGGGGGGYAAPGSNGTNASGVTPGAGGPRYGASALVPLVGGSGGGGGGAVNGTSGGAGGGGGGAILVASSGTITFGGQILARGGGASSGASGGGGGAGGAIRLVANKVLGGGLILANGGGGAGSNINGTGTSNGGSGGVGFIRVEAYDYSGFAPNTNPTAISFTLPHPVSPQNAPALRIASVAGVATPASPLGSLHGVPDVVVPTSQANPVTVALEASNVPTGTVVTVTLTPSQGARTTAQSSALAGSDSASTATASVSLPAGMCVITATAVIDLTQSASARAPLMMDGERVDRIEVAATFGGASEVTYVTHSGRRIKKSSD